MDAGEHAEPEKRELHGIAGAVPVPCLQRCVVAEDADLDRALKPRTDLGARP